jgi:hypothetical protein
MNCPSPINSVAPQRLSSMQTTSAAMVFLMLWLQMAVNAQTTRVLFLGNSYTAANDLPGMFHDVALSAGDSVFYDSNTPGGFTLQGHVTDPGSAGKIAAGGWDYVVLQEQSQLPSFPNSQVQSQVFPYATQLDSMIRQYSPCAETVFYMTWGRENGDASNCANWPPVCTYAGMDSLLRLRYMMMGTDNQAIVSPVGAVWRYIRNNYPEIDLYEADESHPSPAGTYAAACSFYSVMFRKDPQLITFSGVLPFATAQKIRTAAQLVVYDSLTTWLVGTYNPVAQFGWNITSDSAAFTNQSTNATQFAWDFGDGSGSTLENPVHVYTANGQFQVRLVASHCGLSDTTTNTLIVSGIGFGEEPAPLHQKIYPNPTTGIVHTNGDWVKAEIYTPAGLLIRQFTNGEIIDLSAYPNQCLVIRLITNEQIFTERVLISPRK